MRWKMPLMAIIVVGGVAFVALNPGAKSYARNLWDQINHDKPPGPELGKTSATRGPVRPFDGVIELSASQASALGVTVAQVKAQTEPMRLTVAGRTDYDVNTLSKIRPRFKSLVDRVYVNYGQTLKQGDPVVDLFSADLAGAKGDYESKQIQWEHDLKELVRYRELLKTKAVSEKDELAAENDEKKSSIDFKIAKDKLMVFGLSEEEIANVAKEDGTKKAKMTLRAPSGGVVIGRDVVKGNIYDENDTLLTVTPLDHFHVYGYIYPSDASRVFLGQDWVINCPFAGTTYRAKVESITSEIDKDTKTVRIRTTIGNPENRIKADMLVTGYVEIPPPAQHGHTVIPRLAMVSVDGGDYAFVQVPNKDPSESSSASASAKDAPTRFERRLIRVIHEGSDGVIVAEGTRPGEGLKADEQVATKGSLLLQQMYEDAATLEAGGPR